MKKVYSIEIVIALYLIAVFTYLFHAVIGSFWNSWYFLQYHILIMFLLYALIRLKKYDKRLMLAAFILNAEYGIFNLLLANESKYYEYFTSKNFTLVFLVSLIILILTVNFGKRNGKIN